MFYTFFIVINVIGGDELIRGFPTKDQLTTLREYARKITQEMEEMSFSYDDAELFVSVLKDEVRLSKKALYDKSAFKAIKE